MSTFHALLFTWVLGFSACHSETTSMTPAATPVPAATATVPLPLAEARRRVWAALQGREVPLQVLHHPELGPQFDDFVLHPNDQRWIDYNFRTLDGLNAAPEQPMSVKLLPPVTVSPALLAYIALPDEARTADLYFSRGRGPFWPAAEYQRDGQPLSYTCDHIIHFTALAANSTQLEVIGLHSRVLDGKEWRLAAGQDGLGLPLPRRLPRSRDVAPAASDQQQVLAQLVQLLK